ncbi:MAG: ectonucleotide pyrophosphatase/phosphodiesterase [Rhodothermales bacterium]
MKKILVAGLLVCLLLFFLKSYANTPDRGIKDDNIVILISLDGFRADYLDLYPTTHISHLIKEGVRAEALIPAHPTKTFPNHYTIVTGLYPANNGIVANVMYDPVFDETFSMSVRREVEKARWWEGEPLWVTAEKQGVRAATYFWPGSEAPIKDTRPTFWKRYDGSVPGNARVDEVLGWLDLDENKQPRFITLYFSDVDSESHRYGPHSEEAVAAIGRVDEYIGRLLSGIAARGLDDRVNIVLVSDHGMAQTSDEKIIYLEDYIDESEIQLIEKTPMLMLNAINDDLQQIYEQLENAHPAMHVYLAADYPADWHWEEHRRIPELVAEIEEGWSIVTNRDDYEAGRASIMPGAHGYDRRLASMQAIFVAQGPAFEQGKQVAAFENIHIYPLIAHLLDLQPAEVDGRLDKIEHVLKNIED